MQHINTIYPEYGNTELGYAEVEDKKLLITGDYYDRYGGITMYDISDPTRINQIYQNHDF